MQIKLTSFGEGHEPAALVQLVTDIEMLAMRAGFPFVHVCAETHDAHISLGESEQHPRSAWKKQWAEGKTNLPYSEWKEEDCRKTCQAGASAEDNQEWEQALSRLFSDYAAQADSESAPLSTFAEWKHDFFLTAGYGLPEGAKKTAESLVSKLAEAFGTPALSAENLHRSERLAVEARARTALVAEYEEYLASRKDGYSLPLHEWLLIRPVK